MFIAAFQQTFEHSVHDQWAALTPYCNQYRNIACVTSILHAGYFDLVVISGAHITHTHMASHVFINLPPLAQPVHLVMQVMTLIHWTVWYELVIYYGQQLSRSHFWAYKHNITASLGACYRTLKLLWVCDRGPWPITQAKRNSCAIM